MGSNLGCVAWDGEGEDRGSVFLHLQWEVLSSGIGAPKGDAAIQCVPWVLPDGGLEKEIQDHLCISLLIGVTTPLQISVLLKYYTSGCGHISIPLFLWLLVL